MCDLAKENKNGLPPEFINEYTAANIIQGFTDWKIDHMQTRFRYSRSACPVTGTALTNRNGTPKEVIRQGNVGVMYTEGTPSDKYLYDKIAYNSPLEKDNIETPVADVVGYGKIPKSGIAIPTIVGENYSPDFMYVVKQNNGEKELNIVIETKLVMNKSTLRGSEKAKIKCADAFFQQLTLDGYKVLFQTQLSNRKVKQIIDEVMLPESHI